ncbi:glycosyltransferase [Sulfurimonas aquatica]|uniref:Glycosyltransferase n=1 Tax=Sulfurimonas aquatica TaxID=2672570 RepID=A0A975AYK1_9BACT|nr:glycosyltransferase family 2 protein [Sulfurimonas aquatica]QSZ40919.1 glycosyltransferase [Sulfurimonas aquatica]
MKTLKVLLSTYTGEKYLKQQLDSLLSQTYKNFEIIARDDGSRDKTLEILRSYDVTIIESKENLGVKRSFGKLLEYAIKDSDTDYIMFCDQDDVWEEDKLEKTLLQMQEMERQYSNIPLLVHTDLEVVDEKLNSINSSFMDFQKIDPSKNKFHNLLIQNTITGCTVMINRELAQKSLPIPDTAIMHDWWIGLVASKFGKICYVDETTIKYRQHADNTIGAKGFDIGFVLKIIFNKVSLDHNIHQAKAFLKQFENEINDETRQMLNEFISLNQKTYYQKRRILLKYKLFKHGFIRNLGLLIKI